jgi:acyl-coenzyme A thioesterase PaaI-like protein
MTAAADPCRERSDLNIWLGREKGEHDAPGFVHLADALSHLQHRVAGSRPPADLSRALAGELEALTESLAEYAVSERDQVAGRQFGLPSRGQTFVPPLFVTAYDANSVEAQVTFGRFYLGSNGAAHGGAISLLFDDLLGQLANTAGSPRARTASLQLDYRDIVPLERELTVTARVSRVEGRKVFIEGKLLDGAQVLTEANGLFVRLEAHHQ